LVGFLPRRDLFHTGSPPGIHSRLHFIGDQRRCGCFDWLWFKWKCNRLKMITTTLQGRLWMNFKIKLNRCQNEINEINETEFWPPPIGIIKQSYCFVKVNLWQIFYRNFSLWWPSGLFLCTPRFAPVQSAKKFLCTRAKFQKKFMHEFLTYVVIMWCDIKLPLLWSVVTKVYYLNGMFKKWHLLHVKQMCWAQSFFAQRRFLIINDPDKLLFNFRAYHIKFFLYEEYN